MLTVYLFPLLFLCVQSIPRTHDVYSVAGTEVRRWQDFKPLFNFRDIPPDPRPKVLRPPTVLVQKPVLYHYPQYDTRDYEYDYNGLDVRPIDYKPQEVVNVTAERMGGFGGTGDMQGYGAYEYKKNNEEESSGYQDVNQDSSKYSEIDTGSDQYIKEDQYPKTGGPYQYVKEIIPTIQQKKPYEEYKQEVAPPVYYYENVPPTPADDGGYKFKSQDALPTKYSEYDDGYASDYQNKDYGSVKYQKEPFMYKFRAEDAMSYQPKSKNRSNYKNKEKKSRKYKNDGAYRYKDGGAYAFYDDGSYKYDDNDNKPYKYGNSDDRSYNNGKSNKYKVINDDITSKYDKMREEFDDFMGNSGYFKLNSGNDYKVPIERKGRHGFDVADDPAFDALFEELQRIPKNKLNINKRSTSRV